MATTRSSCHSKRSSGAMPRQSCLMLRLAQLASAASRFQRLSRLARRSRSPSPYVVSNHCYVLKTDQIRRRRAISSTSTTQLSYLAYPISLPSRVPSGTSSLTRLSTSCKCSSYHHITPFLISTIALQDRARRVMDRSRKASRHHRRKENMLSTQLAWECLV